MSTFNSVNYKEESDTNDDFPMTKIKTEYDSDYEEKIIPGKRKKNKFSSDENDSDYEEVKKKKKKKKDKVKLEKKEKHKVKSEKKEHKKKKDKNGWYHLKISRCSNTLYIILFSHQI